MSENFDLVASDPFGDTYDLELTATIDGGGTFTVTAVTGTDTTTVNGVTQTSAVTLDPTWDGADQMLFYPATNYFSFGGVSVIDGADVQSNFFTNDGGMGVQLQDASGNQVNWGASPNLTIDLTPVCFMPGTLIRTPQGDVPVETLARGDLVLTVDGDAKPVSWVGRQTVSTRFADPMRVLPIRIKAGAIDGNVPSRDLLVSPHHSILVDGAMIMAGALVNGTSIVREAKVPEIFTYYHVELDDHMLILAENTPAETFVDNVDRLAFDNWDEHLALYPEGKSVTEMPYPVAKSHRQVPVNIRVKLAERAFALQAETGQAAVA